jgi:hypothetical protein
LNDFELIINTYLADCHNSKTYLKNFGTFLNNLPEVPKPQQIKTTEKRSDYVSQIIDKGMTDEEYAKHKAFEYEWKKKNGYAV